jgi:hypothetical protein
MMSAADDLYASDGLSDDDLSDGWDNPRTALWPQAAAGNFNNDL